jgi:hypothetical protein
MNSNQIDNLICNECRRSVHFASAYNVDRILDGNSLEEKIQMEKSFPNGTIFV